jgi:hypothetical protein
LVNAWRRAGERCVGVGTLDGYRNAARLLGASTPARIA